MTQYLPQNLLALFSPREPVQYFPPLDQLPWDKKPWAYNGIGQYLYLFEDASETPPATRGETKEERIQRKQLEREDRHKDNLLSKLEGWEPSSDLKIQGDPFKTIFVGRINYDTSESKLRRELEVHGPIKRITMVTNDGKPRGYAFIEYEKERDMHNAYKYGDGKKIDGRRIVVDVERGRTVKSWKPRRLGGGLGGTRRGAPQENIKYSGRVDERDMEGYEGKDEDNDQDQQSHERDPDRRKRSRSRDRERDNDRERDRDRERDNDRERDRDRERERFRGDRERGGRDRERGDRDRERGDRDRERGDRDRERGDRDRERDRDRDRERDRDRVDRDRGDRDRDREKKERRKRSRSRDRKDRKNRKDKDKSHRDRDGEGERKKHRAESEEEGQIVENNARGEN